MIKRPKKNTREGEGGPKERQNSEKKSTKMNQKDLRDSDWIRSSVVKKRGLGVQDRGGPRSCQLWVIIIFQKKKEHFRVPVGLKLGMEKSQRVF